MIIMSGLVMIYQRVTSNVKIVQDNCGMIQRKKSVIERTISFIPVIGKFYNEPGDCIFGVWNTL